MAHLEGNNLINQSRLGFLPGKSCCMNLLELMEKLTKEVDEGRAFDVVFLDFAKVFDKVPKDRLLEKLRAHEVGGAMHRWIETGGQGVAKEWYGTANFRIEVRYYFLST